MKSRMMMSLFVIALAAALIGGATMAWFTDSATTEDVTFTAGTLRIDLTDNFNGLLDLSPAIANMNPGDVYDEVEIVIENVGSKNLAWFGNWSASLVDEDMTDALLDGIYINSMKMEFLSPDGSAWEPMDHFIKDGVGYGSYPGWYNTLAGQGEFPVVSLREWLDNNGMGSTPYEHMGALKPGYTYKLTVQFGFYFAADNDYQGDVASPVEIGFAVNATQLTEGALNELNPGFSTHLNWLQDQIAKQ